MVKINMMCGKHYREGWLHIDGQNYEHTDNSDIYLLSIPDGSVDFIYCSHGIAYFDRDEIVKLLTVWKTKLKPGCKLFISTADWDVLRGIMPPLIGPLYGKMNEPPIYHKTVYNYHDLYSILRKAGFINIVRCNPMFHDQSGATYDGVLISLNVECNA